jgi:hypothetical protein
MTVAREIDIVRVHEPVEGYVIGERRTVIIPAGSEGTVVYVAGPPNQPEAYEVEFGIEAPNQPDAREDELGIEPVQPSALATVRPDAITVIWRVADGHSRKEPR